MLMCCLKQIAASKELRIVAHLVWVGGGRREAPWPGQTSPYSEQHNAEKHTIQELHMSDTSPRFTNH